MFGDFGFVVDAGAAANWGGNEAELGHPGSGGGAAQRQIAAQPLGERPQIDAAPEAITVPADRTAVLGDTPEPNLTAEVGPELP